MSNADLPPNMLASYFELLDIPDSASDEDVAAAFARMERVYEGELPREFDEARAVLSQAGLRSIYLDMLRLSQTLEMVDCPPDVASAKAFAESHHFRLQVMSKADIMRYVNIGVPIPEPPPIAEDPRRIPSEDESALPKGGPNRSYFDLLGVDQSITPAWKLQKAINDAAVEVKDAYGTTLPHPLEAAVRCLLDQDMRASYAELLRQAESGETVEYPEASLAEVSAMLAEKIHFQAIRVSDTQLAYQNLGLPDPPPPPTPESLGGVAAQDQRVPAVPRAGARPPAQPAGKDAYGRVNGKIPPVVVGPRVYSVSFSGNCYLESVVKIGNAVQLQWEQRFPDTPPHRFAFRDYNIGFAANGFLEYGRKYFHVCFTDQETGMRTTEAICGVNTTLSAPLVTSIGLWNLFPWHARYLKSGKVYWPDAARLFERDHPGRSAPPHTHFGEEPWTDAMRLTLAKYIEDVTFWGRAAYSNFTAPPAELRSMCREGVGIMLQAHVGMPARVIKKLGYPAPR